jgi:release factor glutamine methyltransferase
MNKQKYEQKARRWILEEKYQGKESPEYFNDLVRLQNNEPVDYIIGNRTFLGCTIDLSMKTLIPREETEYWVKNAINEIQNRGSSRELQILDIFSGSGCIGIAALKHIKNVHVDFADFSEGALAQIQKNLDLNDFKSERFEIFYSDVFKQIPDKKYDIIFSNPPYVPNGRWKNLEKSVQEYEPKMALVAGEDGLFYIKQILENVAPYLKENGKLYMECDFSQKELLSELLEKRADFLSTFSNDQFGVFRFLEIKKT